MRILCGLLFALLALIVGWKSLSGRLPGGTGILNTHRGPNGEAILAQDYNDSLGEPYTTFLFIKREGESHWESHQLDFEDSRWPNPGQMVERNNRLEIFKESQLFASYHYRTETLFLAENGVNYQGLGHSHNEDWNPTVHYPTLFSSLSKKKKHPKPLLHN